MPTVPEHADSRVMSITDSRLASRSHHHRRRRSRSRSRSRDRSRRSDKHHDERKHRRHKHEQHADDRQPASSRSHRHHHHRSKHTSRKRSHNDDDDEGHELRHSKRRTVTPIHALPAQQLRHGHTETLFKVDTRGDEQFARYGTNDASIVPAYREPRHGRVLGSKIQQSHNTNKKALSSLSRHELARIDRSTRVLRPLLDTASTSSTSHENNFVPLREGRRRLRESQSSKNHDWLHASENEGKASSGASDESESDSETNEPGSDPKDSDLLMEHGKLVQATKSSPSNITVWLDLIEFQERWTRGGLGGSSDVSRNADLQEVIAENKLRVLKEALEKVQWTRCIQEKLLAMRMAIIMGYKREGDVMEAWSAAIESQSQSAYLRLMQLQYLISAAPDQTKESIEQACQKLLHWLPNALEVRTTYEESQRRVNVILIFTSWLDDFGFHERALAIWELLLDWNCRQGSGLGEDEQHMEAWAWELLHGSGYESLGDSPVLCGLSSSISDDKSNNQGHQVIDSAAIDWSRRELSHDKRCWRPAQPERVNINPWNISPAHKDSSDTEDPYREIDFAMDVKDWILSAPGVDLLLINGFLRWVGLPCILDEDQLKERPVFEPDITKGRTRIDAAVGGARKTRSRFMSARLVTTRDLFAPDDDPLFAFRGIDANSKVVLFAVSALNTLARTRPENEALGEYVMALLMWLSVSEAKILAVYLLSRNGSSARIQIAARRIEARHPSSSSEDALISLLDRSQALPEEKDRSTTTPSNSLTRHWKAWAYDLCPPAHFRDLCFSRLSKFRKIAHPPAQSSDSTAPTSIDILRARSALTESLELSKKSHDYPLVLDLSQMLLTFDLLSISKIEDGHDSFNNILVHLLSMKLYPTCQLLELIHQHYAHLMYSWCEVKPYRPSYIESEFRILADRFPNNVYISYWATSIRYRNSPEAIRGIMAELRTSQSTKPQHPALDVYNVEARFNSFLGSTTAKLHRVAFEEERCTSLQLPRTSLHALLERYLDDRASPLAYSPYLWTKYINSLSAQLSESKAAKSTRMSKKLSDKLRARFREGVGRCKWSKRFLVTSLAENEILSDVFSEEERRMFLGGLLRMDMRICGDDPPRKG